MKEMAKRAVIWYVKTLVSTAINLVLVVTIGILAYMVTILPVTCLIAWILEKSV